MSVKIAYIDVETGGFDPKKSALLQIACILQVDEPGIPSGSFQSFIRPPDYLEISDEALAVNGITREDIANYPSEETVYREFVLFLSTYINRFDKKDKAFFSGYNATFDNNFMREFFLRNGDNYFGSYFWSGTLDVMAYALYYLRNIRPTMENFKLGTVAKEILGEKTVEMVTNSFPLHDARADNALTLHIFTAIESDKFLARIAANAKG